MVCFLLRTLSFETSEWHFDPVDGLCDHAQLCPYGRKIRQQPRVKIRNLPDAY